MYIDKKTLLDLCLLVENIISLDATEDINNYLKVYVEDVDLFKQLLSKLKSTNISLRVQNEVTSKLTNLKNVYTKEDAIKIIQEHKKDVQLMCKLYSKKQLESLYYAIYECKPLSKSTKLDILEALKGYINTMERAKYLLGDLDL